jgi:hypothetical protein
LERDCLSDLKRFCCLDLIFIERTEDPGIAVFAVESDFVVELKTAWEESRLHASRDVDILSQKLPHAGLIIRLILAMKIRSGDGKRRFP